MEAMVKQVTKHDAATMERAWDRFHGAREQALKEFAAVIRELQLRKGYSLQDIASVLHVTRQRIHQLLAEATGGNPVE